MIRCCWTSKQSRQHWTRVLSWAAWAKTERPATLEWHPLPSRAGCPARVAWPDHPWLCSKVPLAAIPSPTGHGKPLSRSHASDSPGPCVRGSINVEHHRLLPRVSRAKSCSRPITLSCPRTGHRAGDLALRIRRSIVGTGQNGGQPRQALSAIRLRHPTVFALGKALFIPPAARMKKPWFQATFGEAGPATVYPQPLRRPIGLVDRVLQPPAHLFPAAFALQTRFFLRPR